jgi:hypothetical protein
VTSGLYLEYLKSEHWQETRARFRASRLQQGCYVCGDPRVDLHHKTYKRLGNERLTDLLPLCRRHHEATHVLLKEWKARGANPSKRNLWTAVRHIRKAA